MLATRFSLSLCVGLVLTWTASAAEVRGRIVHVDLKKNELQIESRRPVRGQSLTLTLDPQTQVLLGSQAGTLTDLTAGRRARITYEERDGQRVARMVRLLALRPGQGAAGTDSNVVAGILRRVGVSDREVVVVGPGARGPETETTVSVPNGVRITRGDKSIQLDALHEGEQVTVKIDRRPGRVVAISVDVGPLGGRPVIPRLRQGLQAADQVLQQIQRNKQKEP
jgi:hypothetical protein